MRMSRVREQDGAVMVIAALSLIALFGMVVLVMDLGVLLVKRRAIVNATDAASLAAAESFALDDALVGSDEGPAIVQADALAIANEAGSVRDAFEAVSTGEGSGEVTVTYRLVQELFFAPVLGLDDTGEVKWRAKAIWGPAMETRPTPIEFAVDDSGTLPCVTQKKGTPCNYWYDNSKGHDVSDSSNWGFMNPNTWGVSAGANCPNAGASEMSQWITGTPEKLRIDGAPTYVCASNGHAHSTWFKALASQEGQIKHFPVNDPDQMVLSPPGKVKYAVVGFVALKIEDVLKGNDPEAAGTPGDGGDCTGKHTFVQPVGPILNQFDVDGLGCYSEVPQDITALTLSKTTKGKNKSETTYGLGTDYEWDSINHVITWTRDETVLDVEIEFDWSIPGVPGKCGLHDPDPNAVCLVASWQGAQIARGGVPVPGAQDFGLRAIRLVE